MSQQSFGIRVGRLFGKAGAHAVGAVQATGVHSLSFVQDVGTGAKSGYAEERAAMRARLVAAGAVPPPPKAQKVSVDEIIDAPARTRRQSRMKTA